MNIDMEKIEKNVYNNDSNADISIILIESWQ